MLLPPTELLVWARPYCGCECGCRSKCLVTFALTSLSSNKRSCLYCGTQWPTVRHFSPHHNISKLLCCGFDVTTQQLYKCSAVAEMGDRLATIGMDRKLGRAMPLWGRGGGFSSNTMWPGPRLTSMPSFVLIHPTVWPQYTNVTDRTDRQTDNDPIA